MLKTIEQESLSFEPSAEMNFGAVIFHGLLTAFSADLGM
tara:strand:+ start:5402 stop:5518 length:117 start_codon:yes stop_codon:yes gene_type:complete